MDLKDFYFQNIQEDEYHYRFHASIENVNKVYNIFSGYEEVEDYAKNMNKKAIQFQIVLYNILLVINLRYNFFLVLYIH
jgi:hypothetical protein